MTRGPPAPPPGVHEEDALLAGSPGEHEKDAGGPPTGSAGNHGGLHEGIEHHAPLDCCRKRCLPIGCYLARRQRVMMNRGLDRRQRVMMTCRRANPRAGRSESWTDLRRSVMRARETRGGCQEIKLDIMQLPSIGRRASQPAATCCLRLQGCGWLQTPRVWYVEIYLDRSLLPPRWPLTPRVLLRCWPSPWRRHLTGTGLIPQRCRLAPFRWLLRAHRFGWALLKLRMVYAARQTCLGGPQ